MRDIRRVLDLSAAEANRVVRKDKFAAHSKAMRTSLMNSARGI